MELFDDRVQKVFIKNKGWGLIAKDVIPKGSTIIVEAPCFEIPDDEFVFSDIFQLLYLILNSEDEEKKDKFYNLAPENVADSKFIKEKIDKEFQKIKKIKGVYPNIIYNFFKNSFTETELTLLCQKYICNAFQFKKEGKSSPVILFNGTILNHSCHPNVIFGRIDNMMCFITVTDIKTGEELCDSYIDIRQNRKLRQKKLLEQYGFLCDCCRCKESKENDDDINKIVNTKNEIFEN